MGHPAFVADELLGYGNLSPTPLCRQIAGVKRRHGISCQLYSREGLAIVVDALHEILELLWIPMLPTLIRLRPAPTLFGAGLLYNIHIFQDVFPGIKGLQRIDRIQIA